MTTDKMRESFEAAVIERFKESGYLEVEIRTELLVRDGDDYYDGSVSAYWHFWQASRAAVEIDLSDCDNADDCSGGGSLDYNKVCSLIEAAGLKVAP